MTETPDINVVYENTVDQNTFHVKVIQPEAQVMFQEGEQLTFDDRDTTGTLIVTVVETGEELLNTEVSISHGAIFGPDVQDVGIWQEQAIEVIDEWLARKEQK